MLVGPPRFCRRQLLVLIVRVPISDIFLVVLDSVVLSRIRVLRTALSRGTKICAKFCLLSLYSLNGSYVHDLFEVRQLLSLVGALLRAHRCSMLMAVELAWKF